MRSRSWARWATCALAISICVPAAFAGRSKSIASCTFFNQEDKGDDSVEFTIKNSCTVPVDCTVSWRVVCAPDSKKRRAVHESATKLALQDGSTQSGNASAAVCGDDAFAIDSIRWSCEPNKE
jgi:hypothetical protein